MFWTSLFQNTLGEKIVWVKVCHISLQNILLSQCQGLKLALAVVCHFFNIFLLILHLQWPAYRKGFWCFIFFLQLYFQGLVHWWEIYLSRTDEFLGDDPTCSPFSSQKIVTRKATFKSCFSAKVAGRNGLMHLSAATPGDHVAMT